MITRHQERGLILYGVLLFLLLVCCCGGIVAAL
jgi:hypothetical protein